MKSVIFRQDNRLAIRLPRRLAETAGFGEVTKVEIRAETRRLLITHARPQYKLSDLLRDHDRSGSGGEFTWGPARGKEFG